MLVKGDTESKFTASAHAIFCIMWLKIILLEIPPHFILTLSNENISVLLSLCAGNYQSPVDFHKKGTVTRTYIASLLLDWTNCPTYTRFGTPWPSFKLISPAAWRSILMCNKSTSAGTSLEGTPMFALVTLHRTFNPLGVSAPGGKMRKQLLKDHNFLNNSPILIIESSTLTYLLFKKHWIQ